MKLIKKIYLSSFSISVISLISNFGLTYQNNSQQKSNLKITNGEDVRYGATPWFTTVTSAENPGANVGLGGVLINNQWVLSCGHDVVDMLNFPDSRAELRFNMYDSTYNNFKNIIFRYSSKIIINPQFLTDYIHHDLSLIKLSKPIYNISPVLLPNSRINVGTSATVYGYGVIGQDKTGHNIFPNRLQQGSVVIDNPALASKFPFSKFDQKSEILAGNLSGVRTGAALSDSGGPLIRFNNRNQPVLQGVVNRGVVPYSFGWIKPYPGVYASVYANLNWILNIIKNN